MIYNEHIGIIYDVINYGVIYFNKPLVIKKFEEQGYNLDGAFAYFDEIKNNCKPLPDCLLPFFYYDSLTPSFLSNYLITSINFQKHNFEDFIYSLKHHPLKKSIFDYLFITQTEDEKKLIIQKKDSETVSRTFKNQPWSMEMKNQTMFLLYNFHYVPDLLIETLIDIYKHIIELHEKYKYKIMQCIEETESNENLILFEKLYLISEKRLSRQICSICFINQFFILYQRYDNAETVFVLGYRYKEAINAKLNEKNVSLDEALYALADPIRFKVIMSIDTYGSLTLSDMGRVNNISKSTAYKSVVILLNERIITESRRDGVKVYYKINKSHLHLIKELFDKFINGLK